MLILIIIFLVLFLYYLRYIFIIRKGLGRKYINPNVNQPFVSVVVACRNEQENLPHLLTGLLNQDYPDDKYEIIIADDDSRDRSAEIIKKFQKKFSNVKLVPVQAPSGGISRKKNALSQAIKESKGKIILTTDADCIVKTSWIFGMVRYFGRQVGLVAGLSLPAGNRKFNLVERFEYFDMIALFSAAAGFIGEKKAFSCSGQNLAFTRQAFEQVGGYDSIMEYQSGDDVLLMQLIRNQGYKIRFAFGNETFSKTRAENNLLKFLNQRIRWASNVKPQAFLNREFFFYLLDIFLLNTVLIFSLFFYPLLFVIFIILKMCGDFLVIEKGVKRLKLPKNVFWFFPVWLIFQPLCILITGIGGKLKVYRWKK